jgi:hypothetical protein
VNQVFNESPKSGISQWALQKINYVDFLGIENFLSNFPKENLDLFFSTLEEILIFLGQEKNEIFWNFFTKSEFMTINQELVKIISFQFGASNFRFNIHSHFVIGYKLSFFWYKVALALKNIEWTELIGHPKDYSIVQKLYHQASLDNKT